MKGMRYGSDGKDDAGVGRSVLLYVHGNQKAR